MAASSGAIRAGQAFVELFADDSKLVKGLRRAQARLRAWGAFVSRIGTQVFAAGSGALSAFSGAAVIFGQMGDALSKMSRRTGFTTEQLSSLKHAAETSGASLEEVEGSVRTLSQKVAAGDKALAGFGLSVAGLRRLSPQDQLYAVADALSRIQNPTARAAAAVKLLGGSGAKLLPMLQGGAAGLKAMQAEAERLGLVMTQAESRSAAAFSESLRTLWSQLKMVSAMIGSAVAPLLTDLLKRSQPVIAATIAWIRANRPLLANLFAVAAGVTALGGTLLGLGAGLKVTAFAIGPLIGGFKLFAGATRLAIQGGVMLAKVLSAAVLPMLKAVVGACVAAGKALIAVMVKGVAAGASTLAGGLAALLTPIGLLGVALVGIGGYALYASGVFGDLLDAGQRTFDGLKQTAITAWGAIGEALANGNIVAAAKVVWTGLVLEWTRGVGLLNNWWSKGTTFFKNVWDTAATRLASGMVSVIATLQSAWESFITTVKQLWEGLVSFTIQRGFDITDAVYALEEKFGKDRSGERFMLKMARMGYEAAGNAKQTEIAKQGAEALEEIERQRDQQLGIIDADLERRLQARNKQVNAIAAENIAALEKAQADFDAAVVAARASAAPPDAEEQQERLGAGMTAMDRQSGTFSALADRMFSFDWKQDDAQERTADAAEETAKELAAIRQRGLPVSITYTA